MAPHSKIEIYNTSDTLIHTLTDIATEVHLREVLTTDIGTFAFTLPNKYAGTYKFNDVAENWKVKIYLNKNSTPVAGDLQTTGRIQKITGPLDIGTGFSRVFEGKNQGEILERRQKTNKRWQGVHADDIVADIATDLSLTTDLATDTNLETITVRTETYFDLLKRVSDYWVDAGNQVKKDFYINPSNVLVWKARPIRTVGVETFTVGKNIISYTVIKDKAAVKNNITVYGAQTAPYPNDKDTFTESLSYWTVAGGTTKALDGADPKAGAQSILLSQNSGILDGICTLPYPLTTREVNTINFFYKSAANAPKLRILAPDSSNYFQATLSGAEAAWKWYTADIDEKGLYDAVERPSALWTVGAGSPNWWNMTAVQFITATQASPQTITVDKLYFYPDRWTYTSSDATSITNYGQADAEFTDNNLNTTSDCQKRAEALLYQLKDPITRVDVWTSGNTNIKIGDRISLTIPAENISAANYDIIAVEHDLTTQGFLTKFSSVNTVNSRNLPPSSINEAVARQLRNLKLVTNDLYTRVVR